MPTPSVAYRIGVDGKSDTKRDFTEIGDAGDAMSSRLAAGYERATAAAETALRKQREAALKLGAIQPATPVQAQVNAATGVAASGAGSARESAAALRELLNEQDAVARKADLLRAQIDPLYAAQQRYNTAVAGASDLLRAGAISEAEYATATRLAAETMKAAEHVELEAVAVHKLNTMQQMELLHVGRSAADALAAGANPMRVLAMEGGRLYQALGTGEGGLAGGLSAVAAMINPVVVGGIVLTATLGAGAKAALDFEKAQAKTALTLNYLGASSGATIDGVDALAMKMAAGAGVSVKAAIDMQAAFAATGKIGAEQFGGLIAVQRDFAAATGQDSAKATEELAKALAEPIKGSEDLTDKLHFLNAETLENIKNMVEQGNTAGAQKLLMDRLGEAVKGASDQYYGLDRVLHDIKVGFDNAWLSAGRFIDKITGHLPAAEQLATLRTKRDEQASALTATGYNASLSPIVHDLDTQIAALQARVDADAAKSQARTRQAQADDRSREIASAGSALNPKDDKIDKIRQRQKLLRDAMAAPGGLTGSGLSSDQAEKDIAAGDKQIEKLQKVTQHVDKHAQSLARQAAAMEVDTQRTWDLAAAYENGDAAALKAEATRKALTDATKKGGDLEGEVARQLALSIAQTAASGAKRLASLKDENVARAAANDNVKAGLISVSDLSAAMAEEAELRPLLTALTAAQTTKIADQGKRVAELTKLIDAMRAAQQRAREEQARTDYLQANDALDKKIGQAGSRLATIGDHTGARDVVNAGAEALQEAFTKHFSAEDTGAYYSKALQAAEGDRAASLKERVTSTLEGQREQLELSQRELDLVGATVTTHDEAITRLKTEQQLKRDGLSLTTADGQTILGNALKLDMVNRRLTQQQAIWGELKQAGEQLVDDAGQLLNPENWSTWGDAGKKVLDDLISEMIKLAALNPLKNALFGDSLPTLSGAGGFLGGLFSPKDTFLDDLLKGPLARDAAGTDDAPGGLTMVGEEGPEVIDLPKGSSVSPAGTTRDLMKALGAGNDNRAPVSVSLVSNLTVNGGSAADAVAFQRVLDARDAKLKAEMPGIMQDALSRGIVRGGRR